MFAFVLIFGLIPVALFIAAGDLVRRRGNPNSVGRRYFLFLVWTGLGLWILFTYLNWNMATPSLGNLYNTVLAPIIIGVTTLVLMQWREWRGLRGVKKIVIGAIFVSLVAAQIWFAGTKGNGQRTEPLFLESAILVISGFLLLIWLTSKRYPIGIGLIALLYMLLFNILEGGALPFFEYGVEDWFAITGILLYLSLPGLVIPTVVLLGLGVISSTPSFVSAQRLFRHIVELAFIVLIVSSFLYTVVWLCIWDGTEDGIRGIIMIFVTVMASIATGLVIAMSTAGWRRWSGFVIAVLLILGVGWAVIGPGNSFHPYEMTEARALQIQTAIENYKTTTGAYPDTLGQLVPGGLWRIPRPMIVRGQGWCYEGAPEYYRLGTIYREHWSSPYMSVRVYAAGGNVPEGIWSCDERLQELMAEKARQDAPPASTPQPTSVVTLQRTRVEPILEVGQLTVGSWSPDGKALVFGITGYSGDSMQPVQLDLRFIKGETGEVCHPVESIWKAGERSDGLHEHYAWLPDGRFLYVSESGEMVTVEPCEDGSEDVADRYPVLFTNVASFDEIGGHILLKNQESYWLLEGTSLEIQPIPELSPSTAENRNDRYSWSPLGDRLVISRLNGQNASEGAAIFIIATASGKVEMDIPLEGPSEYVDAPIVDWLNSDEVLVQFADSLLMFDLRSTPPKMTDLIRDIFQLDLLYPMDFSSMDFVRSPDEAGYYVGVRANHPRNQDVYVYDSSIAQVNVFKHDVSTILFYPDGQCMRLPKWEDNPTYRDEYQIVWIDRIEEERRLVVEGHVPRSHPQLFPRCLAGSSDLILSSSQGVSLVSSSDNETINFWELVGGAELSAQISLSPFDEVLIVVADAKRLYYIPLP